MLGREGFSYGETTKPNVWLKYVCDEPSVIFV